MNPETVTRIRLLLIAVSFAVLQLGCFLVYRLSDGAPIEF